MPAGLVEKAVFSAGEVDPSLHARNDLARNQTGLAKCENFVVMVEGGLTRRPGTKFVVPLKDEAERGLLVPFEFSVDDGYMLVFNKGVMRVLRNGGVVETAPGSGTPYELATAAFTVDKLDKIRTAQSGDVIFVAWGGVPKRITRRNHADWTIDDYVNLRGPVEPQNTDVAKTIQASAQTGNVTLTASSAIFNAKHIGSIWRLDEANISNVPRWLGNETSLAAGNLRRNAGIVYSVVSGADAGPNPPQHSEGTVLSGQGKVAWAYEHSGYGFVKITAVASGTSATATVIGKLPSDVVSAATYRWFEAAWSDAKGWPEQVLLDDNALFWFRGNKAWRSKANDFYDFEVTAEDDSAIAAALTAPNGQLVDIQWALNAGVVVLGTRSGEWTLRSGGDPFAPLTLANVRALPNTTEGSAPHRPQPVDGGAIFIGRSRRRLHFARFDRIAETLTVDELTLYARNILKGNAIDLSYQRDPYRVIWVAQQTGELCAISFRPDQEVIGWSRHPMPGAVVEDTAVITSADGQSSELWLIVRRTVDGVTRRYVEQMQPYFQPANIDAPTAAGAWFVDSGLRYQGPPVSAVSGLLHLKGKTVAIFADGIEHKSLVVSATGTLQLDREASDIVVGLPIRSYVKTLKFEATVESGSSKGTAKNADSVWVERLYSAGGEILVNGADLSDEMRADYAEQLLRTGQEAPPAARTLVSGGKAVTTLSQPGDALEVELTCAGVYPFTLTGLSPHIQFLEQ